MSLPAKLARKKLSMLLGSEEKVELYIQEFGTVIHPQHLEKYKEATPEKLHEGDREESVAFYAIKVTCPVCDLKGILCYELKAKAQMVRLDRFLVPHYQGVKGYSTVDYNTMAVTVCPKCLFASPDKKDFITHSTLTQIITPSQLPLGVIDELKRTQMARRRLAEGITNFESYFQIPRSRDSAILSYKLSLQRAVTEAKFEAYYSYYKGGCYALKIADLQNQTGIDTEKAYREAVKLFSKCYSTSNVPDLEIEFRVVYLILACYLKLELHKEAGDYLTVFDKLNGEIKKLENSGKKINRTALLKWQDEAKALWEMREDSRIWEMPESRS